MQHLISAEQAKQITGGRTPLIPVVYEEAIRALSSCREIEDAKIWSDKSEALAAWAKIYHDDQVEREARLLKLHAYRKMAQLAAILRPQKHTGRSEGSKGTLTPGPRSLLMEHGLSKPAAEAATRLSRLSPEEFSALETRPVVPSPTRAAKESYVQSKHVSFLYEAGLYTTLAYFKRNDPKVLARGFPSEDADRTRDMVNSLIEWLDTFEQHLPRSSEPKA